MNTNHYSSLVEKMQNEFRATQDVKTLAEMLTEPNFFALKVQQRFVAMLSKHFITAQLETTTRKPCVNVAYNLLLSLQEKAKALRSQPLAEYSTMTNLTVVQAKTLYSVLNKVLDEAGIKLGNYLNGVQP